MSPRDSSSHLSPSHHRCQSNYFSAPASFPGVELLSSASESVQVPGYQQPGSLRISGSWPFNSPVQNLGNDAQSAQAVPISLNPDILSLSLHSNASLVGTNLDPDTPLPSLENEQSFNIVNREGHLTDGSLQTLGIIPYPMSVASGSYFAGPMQPNNHPYGWGNRSFQPMQPQSGNINQQYPPSQQYPPAGFPVGYDNPSGGSLPNHPHDTQQTAPYLAAAPGIVPQHNQARSPPVQSMARPFHPQSAPATLPDQSLIPSSSPYMMNQPAYYLPEAHPVPSSHPSSMSPHASSMAPEPVFSSPLPIPTGESGDRPLRVVSSRPRPQCWDHGCEGREFSTFSNLLRHQREKSGVVAKAECPVCGAVFTRTTARNIHVAQGKCKGPGRESSAE
ncbi:hypothetical protein PEBR_26762 [Penicillium brasilianum]|uniref:C2H2-type domain-containing protein n=1 Tax=Penicillium brasilianum TaxID=104259 RepID=A0A1S9RIN1_PENBI|nr:hypothetical protein PEBR_26762 [Penicillium brasilianum]